jgi:hypothetical protein
LGKTPVQIVHYENSTTDALEVALIDQHGLIYRISDAWSSVAMPDAPLPELGQVVRYTEDSDGDFVVLQRTTHGLVRFSTNYGQATLSISSHAATLEHARAPIARLKALLPPHEPAEDELRVIFWSASQHGAAKVERVLSAPTWAEISANYTQRVADAMTSLATRRFDLNAGGKLILWHGPPGTGKSYALRALAQEWRGWADVNYIVDPERFFGDASYMQSVLLSSSSGSYAIGDISIQLSGSAPECGIHIGAGPARMEPKWRLVVLEDTGELLTGDAKERTGQGLSRLLNLCDGLIGQGLRVVVLITTNEDIKSLHPAVKRPGRCAADISFGPLSRSEGVHWLNARGFGHLPALKNEQTLAELYALTGASERVTVEDKPLSIGFGTR